MDTARTEPRRHEARYEERVARQNGRTLASLLKELRDETTLLFRQEVTLARQEVSETVSRMGRNIGFLIAGTMIAGSGVLVLLFAATAGLYVGLVAAGLSENIALWLSPLIIGLVFAAIGYGLLQKGISTLQHLSMVPRRTLRTVKEDRDWIKEKVTS